MATGESVPHCEFDKLFTRSVPHILEKIFFSLDYDSFMYCGKVCRAWEALHSSNSYQQEAKNLWNEKKQNERYLCEMSHIGDIFEVQRLLNDNVNAQCVKDKYNNTPLHIASLKGYPDVVKVLLKFGANANLENTNNVTPLHNAARKGHYEVVNILLKEGAVPNKSMKYGFTPLLTASSNGHTNTVELLLDAGADPNMSDRNGTTPLMQAVVSGYENVVKALLKKGADPKQKALRGLRNDSLSLAEWRGRKNITKLLKDSL